MPKLLAHSIIARPDGDEMPGEGLARFLELRGRHVERAAGCYWVNARNGSRYFLNVPDHVLLNVEPGEVEKMLRRARGLLARYSTGVPKGLAGGQYVCRDTHFGFSSLGKHARRHVRGGLRACEIREVTAAELLEQGLQLNRDTMARQNRFDPEFGERRGWKRYVEATVAAPAVRVAGAFIGKRLASYVTIVRDREVIHLVDRMTRTADSKHHPSRALLFEIMHAAMRQPDIHGICAGPTTLTAGEGLHNYKLRAGFEVVPCWFAFHLHPALGALRAAELGSTVTGLAERLMPGSESLRRVRLVLEGVKQSNGTGWRSGLSKSLSGEQAEVSRQ